MHTRLLTSNKKNKLSLYYFLYKEKNIQMNDISSYLKLSTRQITRYISELNEDINDLFGIPASIAVNSKAEYYLALENTQKESIAVFHHLKLHYMKQSLYFQLLVELTTNFEIPVTELEQTLLITNSYLRRLVKESNVKLAPFHFEITQTRHKTLKLTGDELSIRLFSFLLLSDAFQTIEWPFKQFSKESLRNRLSGEVLARADTRSETKKNLLYFLYAILTIRIINRQLPQAPAYPVDSILRILQENYDIATIFQNYFFGKMNPLDEHIEILFFNFCIRLFISDIIPTDTKKGAGAIFLTTKHPITDYSSALMNSLNEKYNLSLTNEEKSIFSYLFTLLFSLSFVLKPDLSHFFTLTFPEPSYNLLIKNETATDIRKFYTSFVQKYPFSTSTEPIKEEYLVDYTCSLIYTLLQMVKKPVIHIYLQITKDFTGKIFLEQKIFEIFNSNSVVITDDIRKSNLIISDTMETPQDQIQVFFLENMHDSNQWKELLILLQKLLISQYF